MTPSKEIDSENVKPRVLLVDDEELFTGALSKILSRRGFVVHAVNNGQSAVREIEEDAFDVVILDLRMPGMDGIETLKAIKKRNPLVEVIMLTGHGSVETGIQGMEHGAFDYALKPLKIDELLQKIMEAFKRKLMQEKGASE